MTRRTAIGTVLAMLLLATSVACSTSRAERVIPSATVPTEPERTTTTNPYAIPAVIDTAYVNRVLAGLDQITGDVIRLVLRTKTIPREAYDRLRAIYANDGTLQLHIDSIQNDMRNGLAEYRPEPGNAVTTVAQIITLRPACVFARVVRDYSPVGRNSTTSDTQWVVLRPLPPDRDPHGYNLTSWSLDYEGYTQSRGQPPDPCAN